MLSVSFSNKVPRPTASSTISNQTVHAVHCLVLTNGIGSTVLDGSGKFVQIELNGNNAVIILVPFTGAPTEQSVYVHFIDTVGHIFHGLVYVEASCISAECLSYGELGQAHTRIKVTGNTLVDGPSLETGFCYVGICQKVGDVSTFGDVVMDSDFQKFLYPSGFSIKLFAAQRSVLGNVYITSVGIFTCFFIAFQIFLQELAVGTGKVLMSLQISLDLFYC